MIISVIITLSSLSLFGNFTDKIQMMTTQALSRISRVQKLNYFSKRLKIPSYIPKPREFRTSFTFFFNFTKICCFFNNKNIAFQCLNTW